jgi:ferredoxin
VTTAHQKKWHKVTRQLFAIIQDLGLEPQPMPKMGEYERCLHCGRCQLGCPSGIKWDSRQFLKVAQEKGAQVITDCQVESVVIEAGTHRRAGEKWLDYHFFPPTWSYWLLGAGDPGHPG